MADSGDDARQRLLEIDGEDEIDRAFVSRAAGDIAVDAEQRARDEYVRQRRGEEYYADLLFVLAHSRYTPRVAERMWRALLAHKAWMSERLGREVGIAVAALDYLSNVRDELDDVVLFEEDQVIAMAGLATRDAMTGLHDHSSFQWLLRDALRRARASQAPVAVIMLDVDHFKRFNDEHGHPAGDRVLKRLAKILRANTRGDDVPCRYGGEEFAIVTVTEAGTNILPFAERLRVAIADGLSDLGVTVSVGVAMTSGGRMSASTLVSAADAALYRAKEGGRNRVAHAESE